jgi:formate hydrogenlyase subunit 3/multisubunit Na+/H+ antiporter MnhD subunit
MSAPVIWIAIPGLVSAVLIILRSRTRLTTFGGAGLSLVLAWLAWRLPIDRVILIGPRTMRLDTSLWILGRRFLLDDSSRPLLILIYLLAAFWLGGAYFARPGRWFAPAALGVVALLVAALAVQPILYAALIIEMAALLCIPILTVLGKSPGPGIMRFLTFETLGVICLLLAGWALGKVEANPGDPRLTLYASGFLVVGFVFLLGIFPFHTWVPMLSQEAHPYAAAFVFFLLPGVISIFGIRVLQSYTWLRTTDSTLAAIRGAGLLILVSGGALASFGQHLGRIMGYAALVDLGLSVIVIGSSAALPAGNLPGSPLSIFYGLLLVRGFTLGVWGLALSTLHAAQGDLAFTNTQGLGRRMPFSTGALLLADLSLAAFPLLAGFPLRLVSWEVLAQISPTTGIWVLVGYAGLIASVLRSLATLMGGSEGPPQPSCESRSLRIIFSLEIVALIWMGLIPILP